MVELSSGCAWLAVREEWSLGLLGQREFITYPFPRPQIDNWSAKWNCWRRLWEKKRKKKDLESYKSGHIVVLALSQCTVCGKQKREVNSRPSLCISWNYVISELEIMCPDCSPKAKVPRTCLEAGLKAPEHLWRRDSRTFRTETDIFPENLTLAFLAPSKILGCIDIYVEFQEFNTRSANVCLFI